jgi:hypothetical protein
MNFSCQPCPSHCEHPVTPEACDMFTSQGFGPDGDYEHSLFCVHCGREFAEHSPDTRSTDFVCAHPWDHLTVCADQAWAQCQVCGAIISEASWRRIK